MDLPGIISRWISCFHTNRNGVYPIPEMQFLSVAVGMCWVWDLVQARGRAAGMSRSWGRKDLLCLAEEPEGTELTLGRLQPRFAPPSPQ